jgi:hypothetical protein
MATTIMISTSVNPDFFDFIAFLLFCGQRQRPFFGFARHCGALMKYLAGCVPVW